MRAAIGMAGAPYPERSPGARAPRSGTPSAGASRRRLLGLAALLGAPLLLSPTPTSADSQTFVPYRYVDPMTGLEAFRLLIPKGWNVEGAITWSANPALPAQSRFRFYGPGGGEEFNLFPTQSYFWTNNPLFLGTNPPGSLRFGTLVAEPVDLHTALTRIVIPGVRKNVTGLTVIHEQPVPELAALARGGPVPGLRASAEAGKIRIGYQADGKPMEEEIYAAVSHFVIDQPGSMLARPHFIDYWYVDYVFSFKAERKKLDARARMFQTMIYSLKVNPRWFAKVVNVKEALAQQAIKGIKAVGRIGETVARAGSEMRDEQMRDWERRQQVQEKVVQNFSDHIRGVERFYDPHAEKEVELPAGYGMAWANNLGEYVVTDSPSFNPNVGSNLHWEPMKPAK